MKRFWEPAELEREIAEVGWDVSVRTTTNGYFIFASGTARRVHRTVAWKPPSTSPASRPSSTSAAAAKTEA